MNPRLILALLLFLACNTAPPAEPAKGKLVVEPAAAETAVVGTTSLERSVQVTGVLVADERATLAFQVPGRVSELRVDLGSVVKRGQLLAALDARDMELRVQQADALLAQARARLGAAAKVDVEDTSQARQARAMLTQAEQTRVRVAELFKQGQLAAANMEAAETAVQVARGNLDAALEEGGNRGAIVRQRAAELELARRQAAECRLVAPFDGAVEARLVSPGQTLQAGAPVLTLVRIQPLRARLDVPERHAGTLRSQQVVRLTMDGLPGVHPGVLTRLAPVIDPLTRVVLVEAEVQNDGSMRPGGLVRGEIVLASGEDAITVPRAAITAFAGVEKVTLIEDSKQISRTVTTGRRQGELVEVLSGLKVGERVVLRSESGARAAQATGK